MGFCDPDRGLALGYVMNKMHGVSNIEAAYHAPDRRGLCLRLIPRRRAARRTQRGQGDRLPGASGDCGVVAGGVAHQRDPLAYSDPRCLTGIALQFTLALMFLNFPPAASIVPAAQRWRRGVAEGDRGRHRLCLRLSRRRRAAVRRDAARRQLHLRVPRAAAGAGRSARWRRCCSTGACCSASCRLSPGCCAARSGSAGRSGSARRCISLSGISRRRC